MFHGIDITSIPRIRDMLARHGDQFINKCFTPAEADYCKKAGRTNEHFAARFAAKEATLKALGTGWSAGIAWTDVEVINLPTGQPTLKLHNKAALFAQSLGIKSWAISLSHTEDLAIASVIATA
ncbi:MAG: holo-ACP synthase [Phycisphaerales bacterium]|nr:holo-ACP synthase [Phycisphaerales bacterium]